MLWKLLKFSGETYVVEFAVKNFAGLHSVNLPKFKTFSGHFSGKILAIRSVFSKFPDSSSTFTCSKSKMETLCEICQKLIVKTSDRRHAFILLILKRFHTLFWCFYYWLWTSKYRLSLCKFQKFQILEREVLFEGAEHENPTYIKV